MDIVDAIHQRPASVDRRAENLLGLAAYEILRLRAEVATLTERLTPRPMETAPRDGISPPVHSFHDAVRIARGCMDYGGGYRSDPAMLEAFHHGIGTVVRALEDVERRGLDSQSGMLHVIGMEPLPLPPAPTQEANR